MCEGVILRAYIFGTAVCVLNGIAVCVQLFETYNTFNPTNLVFMLNIDFYYHCQIYINI